MATIGERISKFLQAPVASPATLERRAVSAPPFASAMRGNPYTSVELRKKAVRRGSPILRDFARTDEYVRTAIMRRRQQVAQADWTIERFSGEDADDRVQAYVYALFSFCNDRGDSFRNVLDKVVEDILVLDAGCIELEKNLGGQIVSLVPVDAATIVIDPDWDGSDAAAIRYRQIIGNDIVGEWASDEFIYIQANPSTHALYGWSPVETLIRTIEADLFAGTYEYEMLRQTAPEGILSLGDVPGDAVDAFREFYMHHIAGTRQIGIWGGSQHLEFIPFKPSARESQRAEYRQYLARKIAAVFQVDPLIFGFADGANRSISETMQSQTDDGYKALAMVVSEAISRGLIMQLAPDHVFRFTNLTSRDEMSQANIDRIRVLSGLDTINEIRDRDGKPPVPWGEEPPPSFAPGQEGNAVGGDPNAEPAHGSRGGQRVAGITATGKIFSSTKNTKLVAARAQIALPGGISVTQKRRTQKSRRHPNAKRERALQRGLDAIMRDERARIAGVWQPYAATLKAAARAHARRRLASQKAIGDFSFWESLRGLPDSLVNYDAFRSAVRLGLSTYPAYEEDEDLERELADAWAARIQSYADAVPGRIVESLGDTLEEELDLAVEDPELEDQDAELEAVDDAIDEKVDALGATLGNYADANYGAGEGSYAQAMQGDEILLRWHCEEDAASCDGPGSCPEFAALGAQPDFPAWPGDGTRCFSNCRCEIRADPESWDERLGVHGAVEDPDVDQ